MSVFRVRPWSAVCLACLALSSLTSCDKVQEAVEQAKTEAAKLQEQAEQEAKKLQDQAMQASSSPAGGSSATGSPTPMESGGTPAADPAGGSAAPAPAAVSPAPMAKSGKELVDAFLALRPDERRDAHLVELAMLEPADRALLEAVEVAGSRGISSAGIAQLPQFPNLKLLNVQGIKLDLDSMKVIGGLTSLEHLLLPVELDDAGMAELAGLVNLRTLSVDSSQISGAGLKVLQNMKDLRKLTVARTRLGGGDLAIPRALSELQYLDVSYTGFHSGGDKALRQLSNLEVLYSVQNGIDDRMVGLLKGNRKLRELRLSDNSTVTDVSGKALAGQASLEELWLDNTKVSDATLNAMKKMKNLKLLVVRGTPCTPKGVADLQKALPDLKIEF
jgi:hypothetical protein